MTPTNSATRIPIKDRPLKPKPEPEPRIQILKDQSINAIADHITSGKAKKIIVMTGAGISTAAGIKDFRSPGTGLYDDLEKYNLPFPEAVFDLAFFKPTFTHYLLPLLAKKNLLLRSYTQNIDSLERLAGLDEDLLVEAHGSFATAKCIQCDMTTDSAWVKKHIMEGDIPYCKRCSGLVKPSITFFGESLPRRFSTQIEKDFKECDLLIVLGTSLKVEPFNKLIAQVSPKCPRLLINREKAGQEIHSGFDFEDKWKYTVQRDALFLGNCDEGVRKLADLCGWETELQTMYDEGHAKLVLEEEQEKEEAKEGQDPDEDDDTYKYDQDSLDELAFSQGSSDSLEDITHRFQRSTLLSQPDDSFTESKHSTENSSKDDNTVSSTTPTSRGTVDKAEETNHSRAGTGPTADGLSKTRQSVPEDSNTATASKQPIQESEAASIHSVKATETLSSEVTTAIHLTESEGTATAPPKDDVMVMNGQESSDVHPAESTKKPEEHVLAADSVTASPRASEAQALFVAEGIDEVQPSVQSSLSSSSSCGPNEPYIFSPVVSFPESSSTASSEPRSTSTSSPPYTPLTNSVDGSDVSRSLYVFIPMTATFSHTSHTEAGVDHDVSVKHTFGGHGGVLDRESGLVQLMRRKRRMESESVSPSTTSSSPKREMKCLRGPGTAPPRMTKRRRVD
ncbi:NAD-dependent protein deacetylase sirtuin-2 [Mortierella sp. GBA35]|nr:NAD-dependent protein deacetylase sirtuin-2 [Mortierella sp. GBA35]